MWSFKKCFTLFSLTLTATALAVPHGPLDVHNHHHVVANIVQNPVSTDEKALDVREPSFLMGTQYGQGTYYSTGLGACGIWNTDTDYIAAAAWQLFDKFPGYNGENPNSNPICNLKVTITYQGRSVTVAITDRCAGCATSTSLDLSPGAFAQLAEPSVGRLWGMTWVWDDSIGALASSSS